MAAARSASTSVMTPGSIPARLTASASSARASRSMRAFPTQSTSTGLSPARRERRRRATAVRTQSTTVAVRVGTPTRQPVASLAMTTQLGDEADYRLPRTAIPSRYELTLAPDLEASCFAGQRGRRRSRWSRRSTEIVMNAAELEVRRCPPAGCRRRQPEELGISLDEERERVIFAPRKGDPPWLLQARVRLRGGARRQAEGFLSKHVHRPGREHTDARHDPLRVPRRPAGLSVLRRARPEGRLLDRPRGGRPASSPSPTRPS